MSAQFPSQRFEVIRGTVSELQVRQSEEDFVFSDADKSAGGVAAAGLAMGGLAGAATGTLLSSGDTADKVSVFVCKVGDQIVNGRFGEVTFANGDEVEIAGERRGSYMNAYAVTRPADQTVWMHPHCGRGARAYWSFVWRGTAWASMGSSTVYVGGTMIYIAFDGGDLSPIWFWIVLWLLCALLISVVGLFVATKFKKFAHLSTEIFAALGFNDPNEVDLPKRQKAIMKAATNEERLACHPHARWVYRY